MLWTSLAPASKDLSSPGPPNASGRRISLKTNCIRDIRQTNVDTSHGVSSHTISFKTS